MSPAALSRIEAEISSLRTELHQLRGSLGRPAAFRVPIQSLDPEPYEILAPMVAVIRPSDGGFVATFFDANVNASGDTEAEAFENLKDMIVATWEELTHLGPDRLGSELARQLAVLRRFMADIHLSPRDARNLASCSMTYEEWLEKMREKGLRE